MKQRTKPQANNQTLLRFLDECRSVSAIFDPSCLVHAYFIVIFVSMNKMSLDRLTIGYKGHIVAEGLTTDIYGGQLTCLIGSNGMGKSTLLRTIAGFQPSFSGSIRLTVGTNCFDLFSLSKAQLSRIISVVLTEKPDVQNLTVGEMVGLGRSPYTGFFGRLTTADRAIVEDALRMVGLEKFAMRPVQQLSDGERQKMMIAKALAQQTPVILLDEPTAFLDFPAKVEMMKLLKHLANTTGKMVLLSTHDLELALKIGDRWLTFDNGLREVAREELNRYIRNLLKVI